MSYKEAGAYFVVLPRPGHPTYSVFPIVLLLLVAAFRAQKVIKVGVCVTAPFLRIGKPDVMERENSAFKDGKPGLGLPAFPPGHTSIYLKCYYIVLSFNSTTKGIEQKREITCGPGCIHSVWHTTELVQLRVFPVIWGLPYLSLLILQIY